jgi:hypothetical protein
VFLDGTQFASNRVRKHQLKSEESFTELQRPLVYAEVLVYGNHAVRLYLGQLVRGFAWLVFGSMRKREKSSWV